MRRSHIPEFMIVSMYVYTLAIFSLMTGVPSPQVTWYEGAKLLKGQVERGDDEVRNTLTLGPLTRDHMDAFLTCQASNTKLVTPVNRAVKLDVNCKSSVYSTLMMNFLYPPH